MADYNIVVRLDPSGASQGTRTVERDLNSMSRAASGANNILSRLVRLLKTIAVGAVFASAVRSAMAFRDALAEVSTLIDTTTFKLGKLSNQALANAAAFGSSPVEQAKAFYQAISAGATDAASAIDILDVANRLAIGGATNVFTATDGLTSIVNAYGDAVESATAVSDSMFVAMRAGKTTIDELASGLGTVAPLAATANVSFDELTASIAALTKGGMDTRVAITGVRAILASVTKPTSEAAKLAKQLGIEFNSAGLQARGFQGFIEHLTEKTQGNTDQLALLFGGVEALVPMLALTGQAGVAFSEVMEQMAEKGGATEEAFNRIAQSPGFQAKRFWGALSAEATRYGDIIAQGLVPVMRVLADNMQQLIQLALLLGLALAAAFSVKLIASIVATTKSLIALEMALGATSTRAAAVGVAFKSVQRIGRLFGTALAFVGGAAALVVAAVAAIAAGLYVFRDDIKVTSDGVVSLGDIFRSVFSFIPDVVGPVIDWFKGAWSTGFNAVSTVVSAWVSFQMSIFMTLVSVVKTIVNTIIGIWVGAYEVIKIAWGNLGAALEAVGVVAMNAMITVVETGLNFITGNVASFLSLIGQQFERVRLPNPFEGVEDSFKISLDNMRVEGTQQGQEIGAAMAEAMATSVRTDRVGNAIEAIMARAREIAENRTQQALTEAANTPGAVDTTPPTPPGLDLDPGDGAKGKASVSYASLLKDLNTENTLLKANSLLRNNRSELLDAERQLKRTLTSTERELMNGVLDSNSAYQAQIDILAGIDQPQQQLETRLQALNALQEQGAITTQEYAAEFKSLQQQLASLNPEFRRQLDIMEEINQPQEDLQNRLQALNALYAAGAISIDQYNQRLIETQLRMAELRVQSGEGSMADGFLLELERMTEGVRSWDAEVGAIFGATFGSIADGAANSIGRAIAYSEDLGASLKNVARDAVAQLISSFIQLGLQWVATQILAKTLGTSATAVAATQAGTLATAWAPAAALASLASFGANAAPAAIGITTTMGLTQGLAAVGMGFADGTDYVRGPGTSRSDSVLAALSVGEGVVNAAANRRNPGAVAAMNAGADLTSASSPQSATYGAKGSASGSSAASGGTQLNVYVEHAAGLDVQVERLSENDVRIIARHEASAVVKSEAPGVVAGEVANPNSAVSKSFSRNTNTQRRR